MKDSEKMFMVTFTGYKTLTALNQIFGVLVQREKEYFLNGAVV